VLGAEAVSENLLIRLLFFTSVSPDWHFVDEGDLKVVAEERGILSIRRTNGTKKSRG